MAFPFTNQELTEVLDKRRPVATPVLSAIYTTRRNLTLSTIQVDIIEGPEGISVAIGRDSESLKAEGRLVSAMTFTIPRFSEHDFVGAQDQLQYRAPGMINGGESFEMLIVDKLDALRRKFDRSKEFMAIQGLMGLVVDGSGSVLADYSEFMMDPVSVDFATADAVDVFDDAAVKVSRALGMDVQLEAWAGVDAYKKVRNNSKVQELLKAGQNSALVTTGALPMINGVNINRLVAQYTDNDGAEQSFIPDDRIVIVARQAAFRLYHGPCSAQGGRLFIGDWYAQQSETDDPPSTKIRAETNPLPIVNRPEAVYHITAA